MQGVGGIGRKCGGGVEHIACIAYRRAGIHGSAVCIRNGERIACGQADTGTVRRGVRLHHRGLLCAFLTCAGRTLRGVFSSALRRGGGVVRLGIGAAGKFGALTVSGLFALFGALPAAKAAAKAAAHTAATAAVGYIGLLGGKGHSHTVAAARRQHCAAGHRDAAVSIQWLVVGSVGCPDLNVAAGNRHRTVGIKPVPGSGVSADGAAGDVDLKIVIRQRAVAGVQAVVLAGDVHAARRNVQHGGFDPLIGVGDRKGRTLGAVGADVHNQIAVQRIVRRVQRKGAAFHIQKLLGVYGVIDRGVDGQRQLPNRQRGILCGFAVRRAGLYAVFAVGVQGQAAAAAQHHLRAVLAFDNGVLGIGVVRVVGVVVLGGIGQRVGRAVGSNDRNNAGFSAGYGGGGAAGQAEV